MKKCVQGDIEIHDDEILGPKNTELGWFIFIVKAGCKRVFFNKDSPGGWSSGFFVYVNSYLIIKFFFAISARIWL